MDKADPFHQLRTRITELEWQLSKYASQFSAQSLPKGLFRQDISAQAQAYASEIKDDLLVLESGYQRKAFETTGLALKIQQKIMVLVNLCKQYHRAGLTDEVKPSYHLDKISTRQAWLQSLESEITVLRQQRDALKNQLQEKERGDDLGLQLSLRTELGDLEKRLTLAEETFGQATG